MANLPSPFGRGIEGEGQMKELVQDHKISMNLNRNQPSLPSQNFNTAEGRGRVGSMLPGQKIMRLTKK